MREAAPVASGTDVIPDTVRHLPACFWGSLGINPELDIRQIAAPQVSMFGCATTAQDEFVMLETTAEDGSTQQIVYRNGGDVRASSVEMLCDKVSCHCTLLIQAMFSAHAVRLCHSCKHLVAESHRGRC